MRHAAASVAALVGGWAITFLLVRRPPPLLTRPPHARLNYRNRQVAGTLGVVLAGATLFGVLCVAIGETELSASVAAASAGCAMAAIGMWDDLRAAGPGGGFRGHLRALANGRLTSGAVKAIAGGVVGITTAWALGHRGVWIFAGGAVVALSANLCNLFDLRPGRAAKIWLPAAAGLSLVAHASPVFPVLMSTAGGVIAFMPSDLRERGMLGDTGSNLLGASWGAIAVGVMSHGPLLVTLVVLLLLTAASEVLSFSRVIDSVGPLRALDALGRRDRA